MMAGILMSITEYERELVRERTALKREASQSASESLLDGRVLLLADVGDEIRRHERVGRAIEFHLGERIALGEQQHCHSLGAVR